MTRCSSFAIAFVLLAGPAWADGFASDAFGLFDPSRTAPERLDWSKAGSPDRLVIFAGPKSLVAGKDPGHVVAIVVDRNGNLVTDGTPAKVAVAGVETATETHGGIADLLVAPQTRAGELYVGVSTGARQSPKAMLGVTADIGSIEPEVAGPLPGATADTEFEVASAPLADRFGNPVPDGTAVTTVLRHADGSYSLAQGIALQDRALARFIARDIPGPAEVTMTLGTAGSATAPTVVSAPEAAGLPALELEDLPEIAAFRLTLGPFLTTDGYALADGAQVSVAVVPETGTEVTGTAWVVDGEVSLLLPLAVTTPIRRLTVTSPLGAMDLTQDLQSAAAALPREVAE
ncbi:MAG: hypothetical protein U1E58_02370 [Tabrizicola sp.]